MSQFNERGANSERNSALWGTGGRGGDRSSVLWGKGGRGVLVATMVVALAAPLAATASKGKPVKPVVPAAPVATAPTTTSPDPAPPTGSKSNSPDGKTWVAKGLLDKAKNNPDDRVSVIITSSTGAGQADQAVKWLAKLAAKSNQQSDFNGTGQKSLSLVDGVALTLSARWVAKLQQVPGLIVTPDALVKVQGLVNLKSTQLWPYESGNSQLWLGDQAFYSSSTPAIAVVDSGVQAGRSDFGSRVIASVNLSTIPGNDSLNDERGHGTFVAGIAAGASPDLTGAAPTAPIVSIKVMDKNGQAKTSDVINACQWILDNKAKYNIRVANFSMHSSYGTNFYRDPLDRAVEKLWFSNVVVVAASGNYGTASGPSGVKYSPGNDPFVITVGALDLGGSPSTRDDTVAPWSAYGYTYDGFYKPEIAAPGRYMVGPIPAGSTIAAAKAADMVGSDRVQLSGTSFAAPVVSGTVAQMLARHPNMTPDQVKGALMQTARKVSVNAKGAGVGELTATRAVGARRTPNPNKGLDRFLVADASGVSAPVFDAQSWASAAKTDMSWNSMSWADQSWSDMSWADQSWSDMSWADMSWSDMSWSDMSWADMSWADLSSEDAAEGDAMNSANGYVATPADAAAAATDPDLAVSVDPAIPLDLLPADLLPAPAPVVAAPVAIVAPAADPTPATDPAPAADPAPASDPIVPAPPALLP
jgi:serine protease AprX